MRREPWVMRYGHAGSRYWRPPCVVAAPCRWKPPSPEVLGRRGLTRRRPAGARREGWTHARGRVTDPAGHPVVRLAAGSTASGGDGSSAPRPSACHRSGDTFFGGSAFVGGSAYSWNSAACGVVRPPAPGRVRGARSGDPSGTGGAVVGQGTGAGPPTTRSLTTPCGAGNSPEVSTATGTGERGSWYPWALPVP
jgi:hypothetical protein